ncbi:MAG: prepilin peptidase [Ethanoligenens sp.]
MTIVIGVFIVIFGLVFGSFLNVCICRAPSGESIARGHSHCMVCGHTLAASDLFPVFSYIFLRGRCRYCGAKISIQYPLIELLNAAAYFTLYLLVGFGTAFILYAAFCSALIVAAVIDAKTQTIPNGVVLFLCVVGVASLILLRNLSFYDRLFGLMVGGAPLLAASVLSKGGMGLGDVKLAAACGLVLGWQGTLLALFIACVSAAVYGLVMLSLHKKQLHSAIAFGPFLAAAFAVSLLWGERILTWYLHLSRG